MATDHKILADDGGRSLKWNLFIMVISHSTRCYNLADIPRYYHITAPRNPGTKVGYSWNLRFFLKAKLIFQLKVFLRTIGIQRQDTFPFLIYLTLLTLLENKENNLKSPKSDGKQRRGFLFFLVVEVGWFLGVADTNDVIQKIEKTLNNTHTTTQKLTNNSFRNTKKHPEVGSQNCSEVERRKSKDVLPWLS